jgi:hypothetical protein
VKCSISKTITGIGNEGGKRKVVPTLLYGSTERMRCSGEEIRDALIYKCGRVSYQCKIFM